MIKQVTLQDDFFPLAGLLNQAFQTVADQFGLTKENSPTNNAFITAPMLKEQLTANREMFYRTEGEKIVGFICIEKSEKPPGTFYIEKLAVHPDYRHRKLGVTLMEFATNRIREAGGEKISIGLIDENTVLKEWYKRQGFIQTGVHVFEHLPFTVCYMETDLILLINLYLKNDRLSIL